MIGPVTSVPVVRVRAGRLMSEDDRVASEEPLEIRIHGRPFAVIMRTPGADRELAAGFLLAERVLRSADDLGAIEYCSDSSSKRAANVISVTMAGGLDEHAETALANRRQVTTSAACGLCGRLTIDSLRTDVAPLPIDTTVSPPVIASLPAQLGREQAIFAETGGLHAAGLFTAEGNFDTMAEDVGRHNAVDKVIGRKLMAEMLPLSSSLLFVSGRTSFEIVQKAVFAGVPVVAAVSAPSSLAIDLAVEMGVTLIGFVRGNGFNIYSHPERVR